jgi:hypothetical protein
VKWEEGEELISVADKNCLRTSVVFMKKRAAGSPNFREGNSAPHAIAMKK